ncbi:MAG: DUF6262 family protein [Nitrososphaera sp.]|nr:DUF6262 family protein [Nitrososphaera sp.]
MNQTQTKSCKLSGPERGEVNLAKLQAYLDGLKSTGQSLPMDGDRPNISSIAEASGLRRNVFYTNSGVKKLLNEFIRGAVPAEASDERSVLTRYEEQIEVRNRRILQLEQKLATVQAENEELRKRLAESERNLDRYRIIEEEVIKAGRRIIP